MRIWDCHGGQNQLWGQLYGATTRGTLLNDGVGCLAAAAPTAGSPISVGSCFSSGVQTFVLREDGSLYDPGSRLCVDVVGNGTGNGTGLQLWTCHGGANQRWTTR